jgi:hypothetical protein
MALSLGRRVGRLRAEFVRLDKATYLRLLAHEEEMPGNLHVWLAELKVFEDPGRAVRDSVERRHRDATERTPATDEERLSREAAKMASSEEINILMAADLWRYFLHPGMAECFSRPFGERRLLEWTRKQLALPNLEVKDAPRITARRANETWADLKRRAAAAGRENNAGESGANEEV